MLPMDTTVLWRWMLFDLDLAFSDFNFNNLVSATLPAGREWYNQSWATFLLRSLMENEQFRIDFINRTADHLNTTFLPEVVITEVDRLEQLMRRNGRTYFTLEQTST